MANLTAQQIDEVLADLMSHYSAILKEIPVTKTQFRAWLTNTVDVELDATEIDIFTNTPAGDAKDWLQANPEVGRDVMVAIEEKRREVL
jgi:hypothetical protein